MGKRIWRWSIAAAVVGGLAALIWWAERPAPVAVTLQAVEHGTVETSVSNTRAGTVMACHRAKLSPSLGGQISQLPVKEGDHVKQGELLLELWNKDIAAQAELAKSESLAAHASAHAACVTAEEAQRDAIRQQSLFKRKLVSEETRDQARTLAKSRAAECESANAKAGVSDAQVKVAEANLAKTRLLAPFDGVVAEINGELNEYVTPSPPGIPTLPAVDLIDNSCFYVSAPIDEVDVAGVSVGMPARVTLDAFPKQTFDGKVRRIGDYVVDLEKQARTVDVEVAFDDPTHHAHLLAGYSADVDIILGVRKDVLRIPSAAILEGSKVYVFDADSGRVSAHTVRTGAANWQFTEVLEGVQAGQQVVTNPDAEGLADAAAAREVSEAELP